MIEYKYLIIRLNEKVEKRVAALVLSLSYSKMKYFESTIRLKIILSICAIKWTY